MRHQLPGELVTLRSCSTFGYISGNYIYHKTAVGDDFTEAIIRTPWFKNDNQLCIKFSYHMYGNSNKTYLENVPFFPWTSPFLTERRYGGALRLYAYEKKANEETGKHRFLFGRLRNQGNRWHTQTISYNLNANVEVRFKVLNVQITHHFQNLGQTRKLWTNNETFLHFESTFKAVGM